MHHRIAARSLALIACLLIFILATPGSAQMPAGGEAESPFATQNARAKAAAEKKGERSADKKRKEYKKYKFDQSDFVVGRIMPKQQSFFVGEPVVLPIVLANHTRFPITMQTNLSMRASLRVDIRPQNMPQRRYYSTYKKGYYPPLDYPLLPYDEMRREIVLWGDADSPDDLAFSEPGIYNVHMTLQITIPEAEIEHELDLSSVDVTIEPTPEALVPLVTQMRQARAFSALQLRTLPAAWNEATALQLLQTYQSSPFAPHLAYALATYYLVQFNRDPLNKEAANKAIAYYGAVANTPSRLQDDAQMELLLLYDKLGVAKGAESVAQFIVKNAPLNRRGRMGSLPVLVKYLISSPELDPVQYWTLLP